MAISGLVVLCLLSEMRPCALGKQHFTGGCCEGCKNLVLILKKPRRENSPLEKAVRSEQSLAVRGDKVEEREASFSWPGAQEASEPQRQPHLGPAGDS